MTCRRVLVFILPTLHNFCLLSSNEAAVHSAHAYGSGLTAGVGAFCFDQPGEATTVGFGGEKDLFPTWPKQLELLEHEFVVV